MSDSTLTGNAPVRRNITRKNVIIGLLLLLFVLIALWCHGRPGSELGLLGFTPLVALAILSLIGVDIVLAVISSIIIAMIMTSTKPAGNGHDAGEIHRVIYCHRWAYHYARRRRGGSGHPHQAQRLSW